MAKDVYKRQDETVTIENLPNVRDINVLLNAIGDIGAKVDRLDAVSYTHLDVYKRQEHHCVPIDTLRFSTFLPKSQN